MTNTAKRQLADIRELAPDISSRAAEIEAGRRIDRQLPILVGQGEHAAARCRRTADIVDEDVHTAKVIQNFADHFLDTLRGADVGLDENVGRLVFWQRGSVVATVAPPAASRRTIASPMPLVPPVIRARLPSNSVRSNENWDVVVIKISPG
jgi:hypothetical protein